MSDIHIFLGDFAPDTKLYDSTGFEISVERDGRLLAVDLDFELPPGYKLHTSAWFWLVEIEGDDLTIHKLTCFEGEIARNERIRLTRGETAWEDVEGDFCGTEAEGALLESTPSFGPSVEQQAEIINHPLNPRFLYSQARGFLMEVTSS